MPHDDRSTPVQDTSSWDATHPFSAHAASAASYPPPTQVASTAVPSAAHEPTVTASNQRHIVTTQDEVDALYRRAYLEGIIAGYRDGYIHGHDDCFQNNRRKAGNAVASGATTIHPQSNGAPRAERVGRGPSSMVPVPTFPLTQGPVFGAVALGRDTDFPNCACSGA